MSHVSMQGEKRAFFFPPFVVSYLYIGIFAHLYKLPRVQRV